MVRRHAKVDGSNAIASVWTDMVPAPEHGSIGEFAQWAARREGLISEEAVSADKRTWFF